MKIFVANLPYHINASGLVQLFGLFGAVLTAKVVTQDGKSKGFGFLEMENEVQAQQAIKQLDGAPISDRNIVVRPAETQEEPEAIATSKLKRPRISIKNIWSKL